MAIPKLNSCCCCFTIETGCKILGYFETICGILTAIAYILIILGVINASDVHSPAPTVPGSSGLYMGLVAVLLVTLAGIILLMGVYKRNPSYVKICLIFRCVLITFYLITVIVNIVNLISGQQSELVGTIVATVLEMYFGLVIYSLYVDLKGGSANTY